MKMYFVWVACAVGLLLFFWLFTAMLDAQGVRP